MSFKKTLATLALAGTLAFGGKALAQESNVQRQYTTGAQTEVTYSNGIVDLWEPIKSVKDGKRTDFHYRNWGDNAYFGLDSHDNPIMGKDTRIQVSAYDDDNDGKIDWIRITREHYKTDLPDGEKGYKGKSISFYRGSAHLEHMLEQYGDHLEGLRGKTIPEPEMAVTNYDGSYNGATFTPNNSQVIGQVFTIMDRMYADILPSVTGNLRDMARADTRIPDISEKYRAEIQTLLSTQPKL